eukprot:1137710-Pelagomonas_calceolata.AAC.8
MAENSGVSCSIRNVRLKPDTTCCLLYLIQFRNGTSMPAYLLLPQQANWPLLLSHITTGQLLLWGSLGGGHRKKEKREIEKKRLQTPAVKDEHWIESTPHWLAQLMTGKDKGSSVGYQEGGCQGGCNRMSARC